LTPRCVLMIGVVGDVVTVPMNDLPDTVFAPVHLSDAKRVGRELSLEDHSLVLEADRVGEVSARADTHPLELVVVQLGEAAGKPPEGPAHVVPAAAHRHCRAEQRHRIAVRPRLRPGVVKRRYDSTRRQQQARENRRRILAAAERLFADKGYGNTTIADVAAAAGVAVETVYATFKNKITLLHRAWDVAVGGDERDVHLLDRPEIRAVFDEPDLSTRLTRFAVVNTAVMRRTATLRLAIQGAAGTDSAAAALLAEIDRARLEAMGAHARAAAATGQLFVPERESAGTSCSP
jgi:AcrR family transcriptional regulator